MSVLSNHHPTLFPSDTSDDSFRQDEQGPLNDPEDATSLISRGKSAQMTFDLYIARQRDSITTPFHLDVLELFLSQASRTAVHILAAIAFPSFWKHPRAACRQMSRVPRH